VIEQGLICPRCHGEGVLVGTGSTTYGKRLPVRLDCPLCEGTGVIKPEQEDWIIRGRLLRKTRVEKLKIGMRNFAFTNGMLPSEVSKIESGIVDNSSAEIIQMYNPLTKEDLK